MPISLKHAFISPKSDGPDSTLVQPSNWNAEHELRLSSGKLVGRSAAGVGAAEEISIGSGLNLSSGALSLANSVSVGALTAGALTAGALTATNLTATSLKVTGLTGLVKANGPSAFTNAVAGTDYQAPVTGAATTILTSNLPTWRALTSDGSGKVAASGVNSTELSYLAGTTSNIQAQLNAKAPYALHTDSLWHPYNRVTIGDGALGQIYSFEDDGLVSVVETPLFSDGYEYRLRIHGLSHNSTDPKYFGVLPYIQETASLFTSGFRVYQDAFGPGVELWTIIEIPIPRVAKPYQFAHVLPANLGTGGATGARYDQQTLYLNFAGNWRLSFVRVTFGAPIDAGVVYLDKRKVY